MGAGPIPEGGVGSPRGGAWVAPEGGGDVPRRGSSPRSGIRHEGRSCRAVCCRAVGTLITHPTITNCARLAAAIWSSTPALDMPAAAAISALLE